MTNKNKVRLLKFLHAIGLTNLTDEQVKKFEEKLLPKPAPVVK